MKKLGIWGTAAAVLFFGLLIRAGNTGGHWQTTARADAVTADYAPRVIENIEVKNYNMVGRSRSTYLREPDRVLVVGNVLVETMAALGLENRILMAAAYSNPFFEPEPENMSRYWQIPLAGNEQLNTETVLMLQPDLIVAGQQPFSDKRIKNTDFWHQRGVHTFLSLNANSPFSYLHRETLEQEYEFLLGLGEIFACEPKTEAMTAAMKQEVQAIKEQSRDCPRPKVMILERLNGQLAVYDDTKLAGDICVQLGARVPHTNQVIGYEDLLAEDPDVLFVVKSGGDPEAAADVFRHMKALRHLKCVENHRVYGIALNYTYNSAVKTKAGIEKFARGLYPELFANDEDGV